MTDVMKINNLPAETILDIFSHLDAPSLTTASLTCKRWQALICQSETLWKNMSLSTNDSDAEKYILESKQEGSSWKESYQMNYGSNLIRRKWKQGLFSKPKNIHDLTSTHMCVMSAETWGEIFQMELKR